MPQRISIRKECLPGGTILGCAMMGEFLSFLPPIPGRTQLEKHVFPSAAARSWIREDMPSYFSSDLGGKQRERKGQLRGRLALPRLQLRVSETPRLQAPLPSAVRDHRTSHMPPGSFTGQVRQSMLEITGPVSSLSLVYSRGIWTL